MTRRCTRSWCTRADVLTEPAPAGRFEETPAGRCHVEDGPAISVSTAADDRLHRGAALDDPKRTPARCLALGAGGAGPAPRSAAPPGNGTTAGAGTPAASPPDRPAPTSSHWIKRRPHRHGKSIISLLPLSPQGGPRPRLPHRRATRRKRQRSPSAPPDGTPPCRPARPCPEPGGSISGTHDADITPDTIIPPWYGERLDLNHAIWACFANARTDEQKQADRRPGWRPADRGRVDRLRAGGTGPNATASTASTPPGAPSPPDPNSGVTQSARPAPRRTWSPLGGEHRLILNAQASRGHARCAACPNRAGTRSGTSWQSPVRRSLICTCTPSTRSGRRRQTEGPFRGGQEPGHDARGDEGPRPTCTAPPSSTGSAKEAVITPVDRDRGLRRARGQEQHQPGPVGPAAPEEGRRLREWRPTCTRRSGLRTSRVCITVQAVLPVYAEGWLVSGRGWTRRFPREIPPG